MSLLLIASLVIEKPEKPTANVQSKETHRRKEVYCFTTAVNDSYQLGYLEMK